MKTNAKMERRDGQNLRHQSAVGLLLLTLLVANPLQGFSQSGVINTASTIGTNLYLGFGPPTNFVTVRWRYHKQQHQWKRRRLWQQPFLESDQRRHAQRPLNGVNLQAGGSVNNLTNGIITGGTYGVDDCRRHRLRGQCRHDHRHQQRRCLHGCRWQREQPDGRKHYWR